MNEFLIWDMEINKPVVVATIEDYIDVNFKDRCKAFRDIGLKDINGKSIYADSSIVEFKFGTGGEYHKMTGYFSYNNQTLRYEIKDVNKREAIYLWSGYIEKEIKIIDSIQENKLGLIKA